MPFIIGLQKTCSVIQFIEMAHLDFDYSFSGLVDVYAHKQRKIRP